MGDISFYEVNKIYGDNHILKDMTFDIYEKERVALLGKNGAGKTTVFKLISGEEAADRGRVSVASGKAIGVLDQIPIYPEGYTVLDVLKTAFTRQYMLLSQMQELEKIMECAATEEIIKRYGKLQNEFDMLGGYSAEMEIDQVCEGLKIDREMRQKEFSFLSGGEKTRVNLAVIILKNPEILLLDEPTNHLDISSIEWLEEYLLQFKGTVLFISHDRYFIDNIAERTVEIEDGKAVMYEGNYSFYAKEKEARFQQKLAQYNEEQKKIKKLQEAAKRLHEWANNANNEDLHKRAFAMEKRIERMDKIDKPVKEDKLNTTFKENKFSGKDVIKLNNIVKDYDGKTILDGISADIIKNDRIALIGTNGCGKTTILRLITGSETPDMGEVRIGDSIKYCLLEQNIKFENPEHTVLEAVRHALLVSEETARRKLVGFHFKGKDITKKVEALSGGEKSRLKLCILMQSDTNVLILDEPTNHLDIQSKEWVEEAVTSFKGTILFVSHDRYFINRFANRVWELKDGKIKDFIGSFSEYRAWKKQTEQGKNDLHVTKIEKPLNKVIHKTNNIKKQELIEADIIEFEDRLKNVEKEMQKNSDSYIELTRLLEEKNMLNSRIESLYKEWEKHS